MIALFLRSLQARLPWLIVALIPLAQTAQASPVFGLQEYVRESGKPQEVTVTFGRRLIASDYQLVVINGTADGSHRVSSAQVWLNGSEIFRSSDFNQTVSEVTRSVALLAENQLTVRITGAPGAIIKINISATLGPNGGEIATTGGTRLILPPGALAVETAVDLKEQTADDLGVPLPPGYNFLGAALVDLGGAQLIGEADLEVPSVAPFVGRAIVARVLQLGVTRRFTLIDTAAFNSGFIRTNSPPFPGVRESGSYAFLSMPAGLGIVGSMVKSPLGEPVADAFVDLRMTSPGPGADPQSVSLSHASLSTFIGLSDSTGFAAVPGALPNSELLRVAAGTDSNGVSRVGVLRTTVPDLPDILTDGLASAWLQDVIAQTLKIALEDLPDIPDECDCTTLRIDPHKIPLNGVFLSGNTTDLAVECLLSGEDVTESTDLPDFLIDLLLKGASGNLTLYGSSNEHIVTVSTSGRVTAGTPGQAEIKVRSLSADLHAISDLRGAKRMVLVPHVCVAAGGALVDVSARLKVQLAGGGFGSVTFDPGGTGCGAACSAYTPGTAVQLKAVPDAGSIFAGWSGDCTGSSTSINVNVNKDLSCTASFAIGGEVLAPSTSSHYEFVIYTVPTNVNGATVTATVTWASDWYLPPPNEHTSSFANLVEIPYRGGFGCDFIRNYPTNNFVEFESGLDPRNRDAVKVGSITVGPGKSVAIAGSDCFFGDNFRFHRLVRWTVQLH